MKIFVHSGTQEMEFTRLLDFSIRSAQSQPSNLISYQGYIRNPQTISQLPKNIRFYDFLVKSEFENAISEAHVVVCHAGTGAIFNSISLGHRPYVLPRLAKYGEHNDNHQLELYHLLVEKGLVLELPKDGNLECTRDIATKGLARNFFDGGLIVSVLNEIGVNN